MSWNDTLQEKISELRLIADWASMVGYGRVRDSCRTAISELLIEQQKTAGLWTFEQQEKTNAIRKNSTGTEENL